MGSLIKCMNGLRNLLSIMEWCQTRTYSLSYRTHIHTGVRHFLLKLIHLLLILSIDIDEYLPGQTLEWCRSILTEFGFSDLKYEDVFTNGDRIHTQAYLQLRNCINDHIISGSQPFLEESQKPTQERGFHPDMDAAIDQVHRSQSGRLGLDYNLHNKE